jgi:hypothetical protein
MQEVHQRIINQGNISKPPLKLDIQKPEIHGSG